MALYDYEKQLGDLNLQHSQSDATNAYARFISQQRFNRQRQDMTTGFQRGFPQFTGGFAHQLGSGIRSGVFQNKLNQYVGDYGQAQSRLDESQAGDASQYDQMKAIGDSGYQKALLALQEELQRQNAMQNPYQGYQGVYQ